VRKRGTELRDVATLSRGKRGVAAEVAVPGIVDERAGVCGGIGVWAPALFVQLKREIMGGAGAMRGLGPGFEAERLNRNWRNVGAASRLRSPGMATG
jgi:hypothetical protein